MNIKLMIYEEWLKNNPALRDEKTEEQCNECNGTGESECRYCGGEVNCEWCDGGGTVMLNKTRAMYDAQIAKDNSLISRITGDQK